MNYHKGMQSKRSIPLALSSIYAVYFILGYILLTRFGLSLATGKLNGPLSIFTGNFLFDEWSNVVYFVYAMGMLTLLILSIDLNFSNKMYLSLAVLPFILSSVGTGIAYGMGAVVSGQSGVMSVFGGMFVVYVTLEYIKRLQNVPKNSSVKATTILIFLFVIVMAVCPFSFVGVVLVDHFISFALGIIIAVFIYKSNFHFSRLAPNDRSLVQPQEVL